MTFKLLVVNAVIGKKKGRGFEPRPWEFTGYMQTIRISLSLPQPELEERLVATVIEKSKVSSFIIHKEKIVYKIYNRVNLITNPCQATFSYHFMRKQGIYPTPASMPD
jgi:hypothetical protein